MLDYDVVIAGAGIGGSALATVLARAGLGVLVLEKETEYRDRVRGEWMAPWGVAEAQAARALRRRSAPPAAITSTEQRTYHDAIDAEPTALNTHRPRRRPARRPGAALPRAPDDVPRPFADGASRPARACCAASTTSRSARSRARAADGRASRTTARRTRSGARLVVGADGRGSAHPQAGRHRAPPRPDPSSLRRPPRRGRRRLAGDASRARASRATSHYLIFPQGNGRVRLYLGYAARAAPAPERPGRRRALPRRLPSARPPRRRRARRRAPGRSVPGLRQRGHLDRRAGRRGRRAGRRRRRPQRPDHRPGPLDHAPRRPHRARHPARRRRLVAGRLRAVRRGAPRAHAPPALRRRPRRRPSRTSSAPPPRRGAPAPARARPRTRPCSTGSSPSSPDPSAMPASAFDAGGPRPPARAA